MKSKVYRYGKNNVKWYKRLDFIKIAIVAVFTFLIALLFFNFIGKDLSLALSTALEVTILIVIYVIIKSLISNRDTVYIVEKNKIKYLESHKGKEGSLITGALYRNIINSNDAVDIYSNIEKYEGVDTGEVKSIVKAKKCVNRTIITALVFAKVWKPEGLFTIKKLDLITKECKKKFVIPNDYDNYEELIDKFIKSE